MKLTDVMKRLDEAGFDVTMHHDKNNANRVYAAVGFKYRVFHGTLMRPEVCFTFTVAARLDKNDAPRFHERFAEAVAKRAVRTREYDDAVAAEAHRVANRPVARSLAPEAA
jgi:hypothetical protein